MPDVIFTWLGYMAAGYMAALLVEWLAHRRWRKAVPASLPEKELSRETLAERIQSFLDVHEPGFHLRFGGGKLISRFDVDCIVELMLKENRLWFELCSSKRTRDEVVVLNQVLKLQNLGWRLPAGTPPYTRSWWRGMQLTRWWRDLGTVESTDSNGIAGLILETFWQIYGLPCLYASSAWVSSPPSPPDQEAVPVSLPEKELSRETLAEEIKSFLDEREPGDYLRFGGGKRISDGDADCIVELMLEENRLWLELCSSKRTRDEVVVRNQVLKLQNLGWRLPAATPPYTRSWLRGRQLTRWWRDLGEVESADSNGIAESTLETFRQIYGLPCLYHFLGSVIPPRHHPDRETRQDQARTHGASG